MDDNLSNGILAVCKVLNKHSVQYLIVGGTAVALHGYFRKSLNSSGSFADKLDLDFWYNPGYDNYFRLLDALEELGQNVSEFKNEIAPIRKNHFSNLNLKNLLLIFCQI